MIMAYQARVKLNVLILFHIAESIAPSSALPIGATRVVSEIQPVLVDPAQKGSGLLNSVLALLAPLNPDENERYDEEVLDLNVTAFFVVCVYVATHRFAAYGLPLTWPE